MLAGPSEDALICFPTRVVATPAGGSAFTFTMFQAPSQPDEQFESQHASLLREFENLERRFGASDLVGNRSLQAREGRSAGPDSFTPFA
jgi:hypothetical protein